MTKTLCLALLLAARAAAAADEHAVRLWLETETAGGALTIVAHVSAWAAASLVYEIVSEKEGRSGRSRTRQSGRVALEPGEPRSLARLGLAVEPGDRCTVTVRLLEGAGIVAERTLTCPP